MAPSCIFFYFEALKAPRRLCCGCRLLFLHYSDSVWLAEKATGKIEWCNFAGVLVLNAVSDARLAKMYYIAKTKVLLEESESGNDKALFIQQQLLRTELSRRKSEALPGLQANLNLWKKDMLGQALCDSNKDKFEDGYNHRILRYV